MSESPTPHPAHSNAQKAVFLCYPSCILLSAKKTNKKLPSDSYTVGITSQHSVTVINVIDFCCLTMSTLPNGQLV